MKRFFLQLIFFRPGPLIFSPLDPVSASDGLGWSAVSVKRVYRPPRVFGNVFLLAGIFGPYVRPLKKEGFLAFGCRFPLFYLGEEARLVRKNVIQG